MNWTLRTLPLLLASVVSFAGAAELAPTDSRAMRALADELSDCVGVFHFLQHQLTAEGKPGNGEAAEQVANGYEMAAEYLYGHAWVADHPGADPPTYEHFAVRVNGRADLKRVDLRAALENKKLKLSPELNRCKRRDSVVETIIPLVKADAGIE